MNAQFLSIAKDPRIIPGMRHYCDEWCHYCPVTERRIYTKVFRAVVAVDMHAAGAHDEDALVCGKLALVSIDRSFTALERLRASFDEMPLQELQGMLNHLRAGLETKVPGARACVRPGLDRPVAA